jgi:hypothetical protein
MKKVARQDFTCGWMFGQMMEETSLRVTRLLLVALI